MKPKASSQAVAVTMHCPACRDGITSKSGSNKVGVHAILAYKRAYLEGCSKHAELWDSEDGKWRVREREKRTS